MTKEEILHKEIDLIQGVINRMAHNSFMLKGWLVTIIVAVLALTKDTLLSNDIKYLSLLLIFPAIVFWYLDAFFLHKERCYRKLYSWVIKNRLVSNDHMYSLDYKRFEKEVSSVFCIMLSKTLFPFYGMAVLFLFGIFIYNIFY